MYRRDRWLAVAGAILFVAVVEALSDTVLDPLLPFPFDTLLVVVTVAVVGIGAAAIAFRQIDRLAAALMERNEELEVRNATLRAVYRVSLTVAGHGQSERALEAIVRHARELLHADAALLAVEGPAGEQFLRAVSGSPDVLRYGREPAARPEDSGASQLDRYLRAGAAIRLESPLRHDGGAFGTLGVATRDARHFSAIDVETLSSLATLAAIALETARLEERLRELAVRGERERIAREMHDGLAQVLGYVNTKSQAVEELLASSRLDEARVQIAELSAAARSVYVDVREAILGLTTPIPPGRSLVGALEEYGRRFAEASKIAVRVRATPAAAGAILSPSAEAEVFRIAQEALTNIRKHAGAARATIELSIADGQLAMRIEDDGRGFDPLSAGEVSSAWPHFGLEGMRERARGVGGTIAWHAAPGSGTIVELSVPLQLAAHSG